jgi:hypothetical protein
MAAIVKRGTRSAPKFYVQFHRGQTPDGEPLRLDSLFWPLACECGERNVGCARHLEHRRLEHESAFGGAYPWEPTDLKNSS